MDTDKVHYKAILSNILNRLRSNEGVLEIVLAVLVGVAAGFGAVLFWEMIELFSWFFFKEGAEALAPLGKYYVIIIPAIGGLILGPIIYFLGKEAKGEGPPEAMEAVAIRGGRIRPRIMPIKVLVSSLCIGSGGSVGREGPIVQIGASIGSSLGQWLHLSEESLKTLALCGVAGGISATFNAPLAGMIFALEVVGKRVLTPRFVYIVLSSVSANVIARIFLFTEEQPTSFTVPQYTIVSYWELILYVLLGIIVALVAVGFMRFFYKVEDAFNKLKVPAYLKPAIGGLVVGVIGFYYPEVFGVGYGTHYGVGGSIIQAGAVDKMLAGEITLTVIIVILALKMLASSITLGSGGSGGIFAPSLFMGAALGGAFGIMVHQSFPAVTAASGAYALVGMGAFFATIVRGPITAIIMLFEMTLDYALILPLMIVVVVSSLIARQFTTESIYTMRLLRRNVDIRQLEETSPMRMVTVGEVMTKNYPSVPSTMTVEELIARLCNSGHHGYTVIDKDGNFSGMVTLSDVEAAVARGSIADLTVGNIASKSVITAYPDQYLHDVMVGLGEREVGRIPVVDRSDPKRLLGCLRRHDIIRAYARKTAGKPLR